MSRQTGGDYEVCSSLDTKWENSPPNPIFVPRPYFDEMVQSSGLSVRGESICFSVFLNRINPYGFQPPTTSVQEFLFLDKRKG